MALCVAQVWLHHESPICKFRCWAPTLIVSCALFPVSTNCARGHVARPPKQVRTKHISVRSIHQNIRVAMLKDVREASPLCGRRPPQAEIMGMLFAQFQEEFPSVSTSLCASATTSSTLRAPPPRIEPGTPNYKPTIGQPPRFGGATTGNTPRNHSARDGPAATRPDPLPTPCTDIKPPAPESPSTLAKQRYKVIHRHMQRPRKSTRCCAATDRTASGDGASGQLQPGRSGLPRTHPRAHAPTNAYVLERPLGTRTRSTRALATTSPPLLNESPPSRWMSPRCGQQAPQRFARGLLYKALNLLIEDRAGTRTSATIV